MRHKNKYNLSQLQKNILRVFAHYTFLPKDGTILVSRFKQLQPLWKYTEAVYSLRAQGYIKSLAIDCPPDHNRKDAFVLTRKGIDICQKEDIAINPRRDTMLSSPSCWLHRAMVEFLFYGKDYYTSSSKLYYILKKEISLPVRGVSTVGYVKGRKIMPVYYVNDKMPIVNPQREKTAKGVIERRYNMKYNFSDSDKIIVFENLEDVDTAVNATENYNKSPSRKIRPLYCLGENVFVYGRTYPIFNNNQESKILDYVPYLSEIDEILDRAEFMFMLPKHGEQTIKKYASSAYEDNDVVVYSMPFFEINKYEEISRKCIYDKRKIIVHTSEFSDDKLKLYGDNFEKVKDLDKHLDLAYRLLKTPISEKDILDEISD